MRYASLLILLIPFMVLSQNPYPQDYFRKPLDIPLVLSGTFAELRSNHFHSGLDIKTQQRQGLKVYTAAKGHVSRIKIAHGGYGKALYITHPNGYTSVYAHLQKFAPKIEEYVKKQQYEQESYTIELFPKAEELRLETDEVVAYSGNSGSSGGPHLHFEIRDKQERPINPMMFGIDTKDTRKPMLLRAFAYPIDESSHVNQTNKRTELRLIPISNGQYKVEEISAYGKIGFGVVSYDQQDMAPNKNGVSNIETTFNGSNSLEIDFKRFSFGETKHLNRLVDYGFRKTRKSRIQKLFIESNNPLSLYKRAENNGYVTIEDETSSVYKVKITDYKGNETWLTIPIKGKLSDDIEPRTKRITEHFIRVNQFNELEKDNIRVSFPNNTFYDDFYIDFDVQNDTLKLHEPIIPAQKYFYINFDISHYNGPDKEKLYVASVSKYGKTYYTRSELKGNILTGTTKSLGTYTLAIDDEKPTIRPINFKEGKWLSKYRYLKVEIDDKNSGIDSYRATINGKWILMEYDYKRKSLVYDFNDNVVLDTKNILKIIVTDKTGNSSTFEATFYRK
ncbi:MAG: M23 family metallopeptidase [Bacteroidia bacterium]|nr:M23 family metallopeptidase [Bacteroidia bacterium]